MILKKEFIKETSLPISNDELVFFEKSNKVLIPQEYKQLLSFSNGIKLTTHYFKNSLGEIELIVEFLSLSNLKWAIEEIELFYSHAKIEHKNTIFFPFAIGGGSTLFCIFSENNKIYHWDYQNYDWENPLSMYKLVANSLEDLLENLVAEE